MNLIEEILKEYTTRQIVWGVILLVVFLFVFIKAIWIVIEYERDLREREKREKNNKTRHDEP